MADEPGDAPPAEEPKYDQDFFLALAAKGKDAWNAWRRDPANKGVRVTFAGVNFSEWPGFGVNFSGFEFGDWADFSRCNWPGCSTLLMIGALDSFSPGRAFFTGAVFGDPANFAGAVFGSYATFADAAFGREAQFTHTAFGHSADFTRAGFGHFANFTGAAFGEGATFLSAVFETSTKFIGVAFGNQAVFSGATFGDHANFIGAAFDWSAVFSGAAFGDHANFIGAAYGNQAIFADAVFGDRANFTGAAFGREANFEDVIFKNRVEFTGKSNEQLARMLEAGFPLEVDASTALERRRYEESWKLYDSGPHRFSNISFANARFDGEANFSGRSFEQRADFTDARFYSPPDFDGASNVARIDFTGAHIGFVRPGRLFHLTKDSRIPIRLRALRKIAEETKNHDLERDLYIEERKAERGVYLRLLREDLKKGPGELRRKLEDIDKKQMEVWSNWRNKVWARITHMFCIPVKIARFVIHLLWIIVMGLYWALADYGRSFVRPLALLGRVVI